MYTDNLNNYKSFPNTTSCYLDGRYFNKIFSKYPGLIKEPLNITLSKPPKNTDTSLRYTNFMNQIKINNKYIGLMRVIINTPESRHSNLLIIDYNGEKIYRYEPNGTKSPYYKQINKIIEEYMDMYLDFDMYDIDAQVIDNGNPICTSKGIKNGFCVAYVTKFGYDYLNGKIYDPSNILKFSRIVEDLYGPLDNNYPDIEYGLFTGSGFNNRNALIGGLGGAAIGGLVTGSGTGVLIGGLGGGLLGGII